MLYRETKPSVQSEHFVQGFWTLEDDSITGKPQRVVPDGHPELILNLGEPFEVFERGEWHRQPRCFLAGQITGPLFLRANGPAKIRGIRFRPYGAAQVWGTPMDELTGRFTPLADLNATLAAKLDQALESGGSTQLIEGCTGNRGRQLEAGPTRGRGGPPHKARPRGGEAQGIGRRFGPERAPA